MAEDHQPMMIPRKGRKRSQSTSKLHWLVAVKQQLIENDSLQEGYFLHSGMLIKLKLNPDDEKIKPQGLKLPYKIPAESEANPEEVPDVRESASSIESCVDDSIHDATNSGNEIVVDEETDGFIHEIMAYMGVPMNDANKEIYLATAHACNCLG
jgi:hypothetical protein